MGKFMSQFDIKVNKRIHEFTHSKIVGGAMHILRYAHFFFCPHSRPVGGGTFKLVCQPRLNTKEEEA